MTIAKSLRSSMRKWKQILLILVAILSVSAATTVATAQEKKSEHAIADFEGEESISGYKTSHKASVTQVDDVPEGGGKLAVRTVVDSDAGTTQRTACLLVDLSNEACVSCSYSRADHWEASRARAGTDTRTCRATTAGRPRASTSPSRRS